MDNTEALSLLREHLETYRRHSYAELASLIARSPYHAEVIGLAGTKYTIEVEVEQWDQNILVDGWIDDGKWRAFMPLGSGFTMTPDGTCRGHSPADG